MLSHSTIAHPFTLMHSTVTCLTTLNLTNEKDLDLVSHDSVSYSLNNGFADDAFKDYYPC